MPESDPRTDSAGVPGMLVLMATATVIVTAIIGAVIASDSWVMLVLAMTAVLAGAIIVTLTIGRALGQDDTEPRPPLGVS